MMRKCHLNNLSGRRGDAKIPVLRKRFTGQPEHVINYFFFLAEEVREIMASLGYRHFDDMVGQMQMLDQEKVIEHWEGEGARLLAPVPQAGPLPGTGIYRSERQDHKLAEVLDRELIAKAATAIETRRPVLIEAAIKNTNRSTGAMLSGVVAKRHGHAGLPDETCM